MANQSPARFKYEKWVWAAQMPFFFALYFISQYWFNKITLLYIAEVSIYALVKGAGGQEQAAEARDEASDNG